MDLQNKVAIITGGSGGLGMAAAKAYLAKGAKVAVFDLQEGDAKALAEANPGQIKFYETNVTSEENVAANINQVVEDFGAIDVCINCAGFGPSAKTYSSRKGPHPVDQFQNVINVNLVGTFNVLRLAVEKMSANEGEEKGDQAKCHAVSLPQKRPRRRSDQHMFRRTALHRAGDLEDSTLSIAARSWSSRCSRGPHNSTSSGLFFSGKTPNRPSR